MRSKYHRGPSPTPPRRVRRGRQAAAAIALLVIGAAVALSATWIVSRNEVPATQASATTPGTTSAPGSAPTAGSAAAASAAPSAPASAAPSPAAPVLEAEMPHAVNGTTLTVESATDATSLGSAPSNRALDTAVTRLGKTAADLEIAEAYDPSGALALSVLGFRVAGVAPATLRPLILDAWLSVATPGVTTSSVNLLGTPSTRVSYGDSGPDEYVFVHADGVFIVEATDQSLAATVVGAMPTAAASSAP